MTWSNSRSQTGRNWMQPWRPSPPWAKSPPTADAQAGRVQVHAGDRGSEVLVEAVRCLDAAGIATTGLGVRRPSLDDVFLSLTGHGAEDDAVMDGAASGRRRRGQHREE